MSTTYLENLTGSILELVQQKAMQPLTIYPTAEDSEIELIRCCCLSSWTSRTSKRHRKTLRVTLSFCEPITSFAFILKSKMEVNMSISAVYFSHPHSLNTSNRSSNSEAGIENKPGLCWISLVSIPYRFRRSPTSWKLAGVTVSEAFVALLASVRSFGRISKAGATFEDNSKEAERKSARGPHGATLM